MVRPALVRAMSRVNGLLQRASLALLGDDGKPLPLPRLPTGLPGLDAALGGGLPRGRLVELYGGPGSGKTTVALRMLAHAQREGATVAFIDVEGTLDAARASREGVDVSRLVAARPGVGEEALQIIDALLKAKACEAIVVDSVAALVPRAELLAPVGEAAAGLHARLMSQSLRRLVASAASARAVVTFLNQQRTTFDDDGRAFLTTTGGHALHFYAATRLEVKRRGDEVLVRVVKDRFGAEGALVSVSEGARQPGLRPS